MSDIVFAICLLFLFASNKGFAISAENSLMFDKNGRHIRCRFLYSAWRFIVWQWNLCYICAS